MPCLGKKEYGEKRERIFYAVTWQSISSCDAGQAAAQSNHSVNKRIGSTLQSKKKRALHRQKAGIHIRMRSVDPHFVQSEKHNFFY